MCSCLVCLTLNAIYQTPVPVTRVWPTHKPSVVYRLNQHLVLQPNDLTPLLKPFKEGAKIFSNYRVIRTNVLQTYSFHYHSPSGGNTKVVYIHILVHIYIQSNPDIATLFVHLNMWRNTEGGGKSTYCVIQNFCSQTAMGAKWRWRHIRVWLYTQKQTNISLWVQDFGV